MNALAHNKEYVAFDQKKKGKKYIAGQGTRTSLRIYLIDDEYQPMSEQELSR